MRVSMPKWAERFAKPARYKSAFGGRASGKTWAVAHLLSFMAAQQRLRVACCREFQSSIKESAKPALETAIRRMGLHSVLRANKNDITGRNGSYFFFAGMERNRESIRGWEDIDIVWVEEAQRLSHETANVLIPTIRKPGSELWFTWNPESRSDWSWQRFVLQREDSDVIEQVNFDSNPWLPKEADDERLRDKKWQPELYKWKWLGEPRDETGDRHLLPYRLIELAKEAYVQGRHEGVSSWMEAGLDIADQGGDWNSLVVRHGPVIEAWYRWRASDLKETTRIADSICKEHGVQRINYDSQGVGSSYRTFAAEMESAPYVVRPELFGGAVMGKKTRYSYKVTNEEFFARRNAQMGWDLKLRAMRTEQLMKGEEGVPLEECLFIRPGPGPIEPGLQPNIETYFAELAQPTYRENPTTGKTELIKRDEAEPSPDMYDASALAFSYSSKNGLKAR